MVDTYVTLDEAEEIILLYYTSSSAPRAYWADLEEADKYVCLRNAFRAIELLAYIGRPTDDLQTTAFPRWPDIRVPDEVKVAQVLTAISIADPTVEKEQERYRRMRAVGISSYRIGKFSEVLRRLGEDSYGQVPPEARRLLVKWLDGGYRIV